MQNSGPYPLGLGQPLSLAPPNADAPWRAVVLSNASPYLCSVDAGSGPAPWLQPGTAGAYTLGQAGTLQVNPVANTGPPNTGGLLSVDWYGPADPAPSGYPHAISSPAPVGLASFHASTPAGQAVSSINTGWLNVATFSEVTLQLSLAGFESGAQSAEVSVQWSFDGATVAYSETWQAYLPASNSQDGSANPQNLLDYLPVGAPWVRLYAVPSGNSTQFNLLSYSLSGSNAGRRPRPFDICRFNIASAATGTAFSAQLGAISSDLIGVGGQPSPSNNNYVTPGDIDILLTVGGGPVNWALQRWDAYAWSNVALGSVSSNSALATRFSLSRDSHLFTITVPSSTGTAVHIEGCVRTVAD